MTEAIRKSAIFILILLCSHTLFATQNDEDCDKVRCMFAIPICTADSILVKHEEVEPGACCPPDPTCECDEAHCARIARECEPGMERIRIRTAVKSPGACCDQFECRRPVAHCNAEACPEIHMIGDLHSLDGEECPEDSFRPPSFVPVDECCLVISDCRCKASICKPVRCPKDEIAVVDKKGSGLPGRCCDEFHCEARSPSMDCTVEGMFYLDGEHWQTDTCESCSCTNGVKLCRKMECSPVADYCTWVGVPEGDCCPVCLGCKDEEGEKREVGDSWVKDDCTNCTCDDAYQTSCQRSLCKVDCDNPRKVEGQCCPVCDVPTVVEQPIVCGSVELCPLRCEIGLSRNQWGCFECECEKPEVPDLQPTAATLSLPTSKNCPDLNQQNCKRQCAHGYVRDANTNCVVCKCAKCPPTDQCYKQCLYGFETNSLGCPVCKCRAKSRIDARLSVGETFLQNQHDSCLSVDKESGRIVERDAGEWWTSEDRCRQCFCQQNTEFCSLITCPRRPEDCAPTEWLLKPRECCPSCATSPLGHRRTSIGAEHILTVCHSPGNGRLFVDGETWKLDECISCTCRVGHVLCSARQCPPIACADPMEHPADRCCKICPEQPDRSIASPNATYCIDRLGNSHALHSTWREDTCRSCACFEDSTIRCYEERCPSMEASCTGRELMIKGRCCAICSDSLGGDSLCTYKDNIYALNEEFHDGHCRNCTCKGGGIVECMERQCQYCETPMYTPNSCCPVCQDNNAYLLEGNGRTVFMDGQFGYLAQPMLIYLLLIGAALLVLSACLLSSVLLGRCFYRRKKSHSFAKERAIPKANGKKAAKRNISECESANVSLLSSTDTNNPSISTSTSLIVHADAKASTATPTSPNGRLKITQSRFV